MLHTRLAIGFLACALFARGAGADEPAGLPAVASPVDAHESLALFHLPQGLRIELAAAEPEVVDPVAARFDENGRLWVVEMGDYPNGPQPGEPPQSRIRILEDVDGNGYFEQSRVFADRLLFATGVQPWHGGAIVTLSGGIVFLRDADGDGSADQRETWFTGFAEDNPQLRANHPRFGLDNRVYVANGLRGGRVVDRRVAGAEPIDIGGRDFCFDPRGGGCQAVSGHGQFGLTFDDFGNRFNCSNRNPLMHVVLADRYLRGNPFLAAPAVTSDVAAAGEASRVFPLSQAWTTSILHAGQFTAACGVEIYRGSALPEEFAGNAFTCEPTGNLVHRELIAPSGATFAGARAYADAEFLASPDTWFRPVNLETGPDGALYVVDMYRAVIEHPEWVPDELKDRPDLRWGSERGRIYRIVAEKERPRAEPARLAAASTAELAALLAHRDGWWRQTAARLLYQRQDGGAQAPLEELAHSGGHAKARVHALWALEGLGVLSDETLLAALADPHARVREQAVLLAEDRLSRSARLREAVIGLADDGAPRLGFQVALSLGLAGGEDLVEPLATVALAAPGDSWTRLAVATAARRPAELLKAIVAGQAGGAGDEAWEEGRRAMVSELAELIGARQQGEEITAALLVADQEAARSDALAFAIARGLAAGANRRGSRIRDLAARATAGSAEPAALLEAIFARAAEVAKSDDGESALRREAIDLLAHADDRLAGPVLAELVQSDADPAIELAAIRSLGAQGEASAAEILLARLPEGTPAARAAMLDALLGRREWAARLMDQLAAGQLRPAEIDPFHAARLLEHADAGIRSRAAELLAPAAPAERTRIIGAYRAAIDERADPARGGEVFRKNCSTCHKIGDVGVDVGPSIADARTQTAEQLLLDILEPSRAIDNDYLAYTVITAEGNSFLGVIAAQTGASITLAQPEGKQVSVLRADIEEMRSSGLSLMPEGFERTITPGEMAELIAFIKNWRYLDGAVPIRAGAGE